MSEIEQDAPLPGASFYELISTKSFRKHNISPASSPSVPSYSIVSNKTLNRKKPDLVVHEGSTKSGPVLGVMKLNVRDHDIGLGDPDTLFSEESQRNRVVWEHLRRVKRWSRKSYEFDYGSGIGGDVRTKYVWTWTKRSARGYARKLELRVANTEDDVEGELVAVFKRGDWKNVFRGSFFIKNDHRRDEEEQGKRWELMVVLTALCILDILTR